MRAAFQALLAFSPFLRGKGVLLRMDNKVAVAYIKRWGGTRSPSLMEEVCLILEWAQLNLTDPRAVYVPGVKNQLADDLSRNFLSNNEWSLNRRVFSLITQTWGMPYIDLASTPAKAKCQRYLTRASYRSAEGIDCLQNPWDFRLGYVFPPTPLIASFLLRLKRSTSTVIAVIPF